MAGSAHHADIQLWDDFAKGSHEVTTHKSGGGTEWWPGWWPDNRVGEALATAWASPWQLGWRPGPVVAILDDGRLSCCLLVGGWGGRLV